MALATSKIPHPFIKWAGGKSKMMVNVLNRLPSFMDCYYEPMVGGGAVLFELYKKNLFKKAVISDVNPELINTWLVIQSQVMNLIEELKQSKYSYDRNVYLDIRKLDPLGLTEVERAARFIYLNKTCFNGLYRVNANGEFNVPFGKYDNPLILNEKNLLAVNIVLQQVTILQSDFEEVVKEATAGDGVYFDPPYIPISKTSNFTRYTEKGFTLVDHERLARVFAELAAKDVRVVLSNSAADESIDLYKEFDIDRHHGRRNIAGPASDRFKTQEIIVFAGSFSHDSQVEVDSSRSKDEP